MHVQDRLNNAKMAIISAFFGSSELDWMLGPMLQTIERNLHSAARLSNILHEDENSEFFREICSLNLAVKEFKEDFVKTKEEYIYVVMLFLQILAIVESYHEKQTGINSDTTLSESKVSNANANTLSVAQVISFSEIPTKTEEVKKNYVELQRKLPEYILRQFDSFPQNAIGCYDGLMRKEKILSYKLKKLKIRKYKPILKKFEGRSLTAKAKLRNNGKFAKKHLFSLKKSFFTIKKKE